MSAHRLSTIQDTLCELIEAEAARAGSPIFGVPIVREQYGHEEPDAAINAALDSSEKGLCIFSVMPYAVRLQDHGNAVARLTANLSIFLIENPVTNATGLQLNPLIVVEGIWSAIVRAPSKGPQVKLGPTPLEVIDEGSGARAYPIDFEVELTITG